jgi:hypothetical protein
MTTILSFLPIIILIAIIVSIIFLNKRLQKSPLTYNKSKWVVIGYIIFLAVTAVIATLLPNTEAKVIVEDLERDWSNSLYQRAHKGEFASFGEEEITDKWEFPYTNETITLDANLYEESILVEKTSQLNGKIEVYFIEDWQVMEINSITLDISDYIPAFGVGLEEDRLVFKGFSEDRKILIAYEEPEFTMRQFMRDYESESGYSYSGSRFLYIRVPESLKVEYNSNLIVDFVEN